eukprot:scaffold8224_cov118-Isochrysis_galbana.AAC.8
MALMLSPARRRGARADAPAAGLPPRRLWYTTARPRWPRSSARAQAGARTDGPRRRATTAGRAVGSDRGD